MRVGFIGVGRMGLPMCANLVRAGYDVMAGDVREELQAAVIACGARWGGPGPAVAAAADVLITMLPGGPELRHLMLAPAGVLSALPGTATWIDMTSTSPATSFGLDRCCEELSAITALARRDGVPFELSEQVERIYQRALARYGPAGGELLPVAMLEEQAGIQLRHRS